MKPIHRMTNDELEEVIDFSDDEGRIEDAYDELGRRERVMETFDWFEQDRRAAAEERIARWRDEY